jgi:hypothetical protein
MIINNEEKIDFLRKRIDFYESFLFLEKNNLSILVSSNSSKVEQVRQDILDREQAIYALKEALSKLTEG